jgi:kynurenine formamidase
MKIKICLISFASILFTMCTSVQENPFETGTWVDLTHEFSGETLYWPTSDTFQMDTVFAGHTDAGFYYEAYNICTAEHGGTHLDAPIHFAEGMKAVHEIDLEQLTGYAVVIDVTEQVSQNRDYRIQIDDILDWEHRYGTITTGSMILFRTGFGSYWPDAGQYLGTASRGEDALEELSFPGIHHETAEWLVENREIKAVGLDTASLDYGQSEEFKSHQILFKQNIPGFENVANLDLLPPTGSYVIALPMKIRDGSGAPLRIVAFIAD